MRKESPRNMPQDFKYFIALNRLRNVIGNSAEDRFNARTTMDLLVRLAIKNDSFRKAYEFATDFDAIAARITLAGTPTSVLSDYALLEPHIEQPELAAMRLISDAIRRSENILQADPQQLPEQIVGRLEGHQQHTRIRRLVERAKRYKSGLWMCPKVSALGDFSRCAESSIDLAGELVLDAEVDGEFTWILTDRRLLEVSLQKMKITRALQIAHYNNLKLACCQEHLAVATGSGEVLIVDRRQLRLSRVISAHQRAALACTFLDHRLLATIGTDACIRVWDVSTGENQLTIRTNYRSIYSIANLGESRVAVGCTGDENSFIELWDIAKATSCGQFGAYDWPIDKVAVSPAKTKIAVGANSNISVLSADLHECLFEPQPIQSKCHALAFLNDNVLAFGDLSGTIGIWHLDTKPVLSTPFSHNALVSGLCALGQQRLLSTSWDQTVRVWNLDGTTTQRTLHSEQVNCIASSPDRSRIVSGSQDKCLVIWDRDGVPVAQLTGHNHWVTGVSYGKKIVSASFDGIVRFWDSDGFENLGMHRCSDRGILRLAVDPMEKWMATVDSTGAIIVWNLESLAITARAPLLLENIVDMSFTKEGETLLIGTGDGSLACWQFGTGSVKLSKLNTPARVTAWDLDKRLSERIFVGCANGTICELTSDCKILLQFGEDGCGPSSVRQLQRDGMILAVGGLPQIASDNAARLWSVAHKPKLVAQLVLDSPITAASGLDNERIVLGDAVGGMHFIDLMEVRGDEISLE